MPRNRINFILVVGGELTFCDGLVVVAVAELVDSDGVIDEDPPKTYIYIC